VSRLHRRERQVLLTLAERLDGDRLNRWFPDMGAARVRAVLRRLAGEETGSPAPADPPDAGKAAGNGEEYHLYCDGASRGNPGEAGAGFVLLDAGGNELLTGSHYLGRCTNNIAEYRALIAGLEEAARLGCRTLRIFLDSQLIVRQLQGSYRVKNANLKPLYGRVRELLEGFDRWRIGHVPRAENRRADELANRGIDGRSGPRCRSGT